MFTKILIANRGEIACRVIDTARSLGVATVAVYSDADENARHVEMADQAVHIGGSAPADSYLRGGAIIAAALKTGAQAIHPGYGFLSENPDFVDEIDKAGLVFIGPSAQAIRAMGLKDAAKKLMEKAGVPVVPGYHGADQDAVKLQAEAGKIGYPVMIKAVAGGGGKGMRMVESSGDFLAELRSARSEAKNAFGNDAVLIEKFVEKPRHIEIQVFGDGNNVVHLFERDCSLQRRHQKVIEEAPAPGMTDEMRSAMGDAAVRAAKAIGYKGAGTVEFIVDGSEGLHPDKFWFMEMNTRLQVEHPVTEAVTGIDLVEWQLRVASGESLPKTQDQLELNGHSFEARLYAEDVPKGFLPATGTLRHLKFPDNARADTGVRAGDQISPFYDPMIAKITVHGPTREIALSKLSAALSATEVAGTVTNLTFLGNLARHAEFQSGDVDTGLIGRNLALLTAERPASDFVVALAAIIAADIGATESWATGFALWAPGQRTIRLAANGEDIDVVLQVFGPDRVDVAVGKTDFQFQRRGEIWGDVNSPANFCVEKIGDTVSVFADQAWHFTIPEALEEGTDAGSTSNVIEAPMPGLIKAVFKKTGEKVKAGEPLVILEAMKMEHSLNAPRDCKLNEVLVKLNDQVEAGSVLISLVGEKQ